MSTDIDFNDVCYETRGIFVRGRLKFTEPTIQYKNTKTGKVEQITVNDIDYLNWYRFCLNWGIRVYTKQGNLYRFGGFKDADKEKITKYVKATYDLPMPEKDICVKGWNWGVAKFSGSVLSFEVANQLDFDIPLGQVSQCIAGKNEVTLEFHPTEESPASLMELRFHVPGNESSDTDPVDAFRDHVAQKADIISATGDAIAIFREVQCLTPRGRYDIKVYQTFFQLHGKTFDYKIPMSTALRLFILPHKDGRQMFFVISLDPPIKQGQTRYHYLVFLFTQEEELTLELPFTEEEIKAKYDGKLQKEMSGQTYEVLSKLMKVLVNRKLTTPGNFVGHSGTAAIACSYKAAAGYIYPLERGFIFIHKPPLHVRFEEVSSVNFARSGGSTRSFDFEIELKSGVIYTFASIEKEEYPKLFDFVTGKKIRIKNSGKNKQTASFADFDDSDAENEPDAYLARVKAEAAEAELLGVDDDDSGDGSEEDVDFDPTKFKDTDEVAEEFDSNASESSDSDEEESTSKKHKSKEKELSKKKTRGADEDSGKKKKKPGSSKDDKKESRSKSDKKKEKPSSSSSSKDKDKKKKKEETKSPAKPDAGFKSREFIDDDESD